MSRKNPVSWRWGCPTCGGVEVIVVRRGGIQRVFGQRHLYTDNQSRLRRRIEKKWFPAFQACLARHDEGGYHEPDAIGVTLVRAGWRAEEAERVGTADRSRSSVRVYWPSLRGWQKTLAYCPDPWHERHGSIPRHPRKPWEPYEPPSDPEPPRRMVSTMPGRERRQEAERRRKAKARRHKERQAKR